MANDDMILLDDVVHLLAGPALVSLWQQVVLLRVTDGSDGGRIKVDIDYFWSGDVRPASDFTEERIGCSSAAGLIQEGIECLSG